MRGMIVITMAGLFALAGCATATPPPTASPPVAVADPCLDQQYVALKARPLDSLSEREYAYFLQYDAACLERTASHASVERLNSNVEWLWVTFLTSAAVLGYGYWQWDWFE